MKLIKESWMVDYEKNISSADFTSLEEIYKDYKLGKYKHDHKTFTEAVNCFTCKWLDVTHRVRNLQRDFNGSR